MYAIIPRKISGRKYTALIKQAMLYCGYFSLTCFKIFPDEIFAYLESESIDATWLIDWKERKYPLDFLDYEGGGASPLLFELNGISLRYLLSKDGLGYEKFSEVFEDLTLYRKNEIPRENTIWFSSITHEDLAVIHETDESVLHKLRKQGIIDDY